MLILTICLAFLSQVFAQWEEAKIAAHERYPVEYDELENTHFTSKVTEKSVSMIKSQRALNEVVQQTAKKLEIPQKEAQLRVKALFESDDCLSSSNELIPEIANCFDTERISSADRDSTGPSFMRKMNPINVCPIQQVIPAGSAGFPSGGPRLKGVPGFIQHKCFGFVVDCLEPKIYCNKCARYRTIDGTCNNLNTNVHWGSINRAFKRYYPSNYDDNLSVPTGGNPPTGSLPTPRRISNLMHDHNSPPKDKYHTLMVMQLGQFLDHDITFTPEVKVEDCCSHSSPECFPLRINQPDSHLPNVHCLHFARSAPKCAVSGKRNQFSSITAYVDGSHIYGSTKSESLHLRTMVDGKLKTSANNNLPIKQGSGGYSGGGCLRGKQFEAGDTRVTENPGLQSLHTIFMREHNRIAGIIKQLTMMMPWSDETIYQEARRIVVAEWQNIVYGEFLPEILGKSGVAHGINSVYHSHVDATITNVFATAAYRFGHSLIAGTVKLSPWGSYQLHQNFGNTDGVLSGNLDGILKGATEQETDASDKFIDDAVRNNLFKNIPCHKEGGDLAARNIQRGRDHGLGSYFNYVRRCRSWGGLSYKAFKELHNLYGSYSKIEIFPGGLLENKVPGGLVGRTFHCLIKEQFTRLKDGDRFFFTHKKGSTCDIDRQRFDVTQQKIIMPRKLRDVICDNTQINEMQANVLNKIDPASNPTQHCNAGTRLGKKEVRALLTMKID